MTRMRLKKWSPSELLIHACPLSKAPIFLPGDTVRRKITKHAACFVIRQVVGDAVVETIARLRREHFIGGKTIKEIAPDLKASRNTVRKVLRPGETSFEYERAVQPRPTLGAPRIA